MKSILRQLVKEIIREQKNLREQEEQPEDLTPIMPGPGQEPEVNTDADTPETPAGPISKEDAKQMIKATKGKFFTVTFIKKDGTVRVMNARLGVKAYLKGGELLYNPDEKGLIPVYDMKNSGYRMINVNTITKLKIGNNEYEVQ
jgi:hypothetical protein